MSAGLAVQGLTHLASPGAPFAPGEAGTAAAAGSIAGLLVGAAVLGAALAGGGDRTAPGGALLSAAAGAAAVIAVMAAIEPRPRRLAAAPSAGRRALLGAVGGGIAALAIYALIRRTVMDDGAAPEIARLALARDASFAAPPLLTALVTAPADLYVVDIQADRPGAAPGAWRLAISGLVANPLLLRAAELLELGAVERAVFLECISNNVAGRLMGNALWTVVPLDRVLGLAGLRPGARTIVAHGSDGYTGAFTVAEAAGVFVAFELGGSALPDVHGPPVRLLYPGHYGMRSVKWVSELEVVDTVAEAYWAERGWDGDGVLRSGSRLDTPMGGDELRGPVVLAGLAWSASPVAAVEASHDGGLTWSAAQVETPIDALAWRRWRAEFSLAPGEYRFSVRTVDAGGPQDETRRGPYPSGSSGLHTVTATVVA